MNIYSSFQVIPEFELNSREMQPTMWSNLPIVSSQSSHRQQNYIHHIQQEQLYVPVVKFKDQ